MPPATDATPGPPLLVGVGGFLGAGKTTTILAAVERLRAAGTRVAVVTNDQASGLVDTAAARAVLAAGHVAEIAGGCFCCRFDDLARTLGDVIDRARPDVLFAEAVGSCTDLAATVYQPIRQLGLAPVRLGPLTVVVDAARLSRTVGMQWTRGCRLGKPHGGARTRAGVRRAQAEDADGPEARLSHSDARPARRSLPVLDGDVAYLFERQLAEADVLLLNKIDALAPGEAASLAGELRTRYPGVAVYPTSALSGDGLAPWLAALDAPATAGSRVLELDYDRYAAAEACLGWLNLEGNLSPGSLDAAGTWARTALAALRESAAVAGADVAHAKLRLDAGAGSVRANLVGSLDPVDSADSRGAGGAGGMSGARPFLVVDGAPAGDAHLVFNARVATDPAALRTWVDAALRRADAAAGTTTRVSTVQCFAPARPVPTYRLTPQVTPA